MARRPMLLRILRRGLVRVHNTTALACAPDYCRNAWRYPIDVCRSSGRPSGTFHSRVTTVLVDAGLGDKRHMTRPGDNRIVVIFDPSYPQCAKWKQRSEE